MCIYLSLNSEYAIYLGGGSYLLPMPMPWTRIYKRTKSIYCLLPIAHRPLPITYLPLASCLLPLASCLVSLAYCILPISYCLLPVAFYLPRESIVNREIPEIDG